MWKKSNNNNDDKKRYYNLDKKNKLDKEYKKEKKNEEQIFYNKYQREKEEPEIGMSHYIGLVIIIVGIFFIGVIIYNLLNPKPEETIPENNNTEDVINNTNNNTKIDKTSPELIKINVSPLNIKTEGQLTITATAKDDISGIDSIIATVYKSQDFDNNMNFMIHLRYKKEKNVWEGSLYLENYFRSGLWVVKSVFMSDYAGNKSYYTLNKSNRELYIVDNNNNDNKKTNIVAPTFALTDTNEDIKAPVIKDISINKHSLNVGDKLKIKMNIEEKQSGINYFYVNAKNPDNNGNTRGTKFKINMRYNDGDNFWEGDVNIQNHYESGSWHIDKIFARDNAGNVNEYTADYSSKKYARKNKNGEETISNIDIINFTINGTKPDNTQPILKSITITPEQIKDSGSFTIKADADDSDSGMKTVSVTLYSPLKMSSENYLKGSEIHVYLKYNNQTHLFEGSEILEPYHENGEWVIGMINLYDNAGNKRHYILSYDKNSLYYKYKNENGDSVLSDIYKEVIIKK